MMNMFDAMNSVRYQLRAVGSDILSARRYRQRPFIKIIPPAGQPTACDAVTAITLYYQGQRRQLAEFKLRALQHIRDFVDLSAAEYGVNYGAAKGNVTLTSFDGQYRLVRAVGEHRIFDERIQVAKEKIEACITKWSDGADAKLIAIVRRSFKVNKQGQIDINEVLALRDLDIDDEEWQEAMRAVSDSIKVSGSSTYLRFYQREADKAYKQLSLDISKL